MSYEPTWKKHGREKFLYIPFRVFVSHEYENMSADATNLSAPLRRTISRRVFICLRHCNCYIYTFPLSRHHHPPQCFTLLKWRVLSFIKIQPNISNNRRDSLVKRVGIWCFSKNLLFYSFYIIVDSSFLNYFLYFQLSYLFSLSSKSISCHLELI